MYSLIPREIDPLFDSFFAPVVSSKRGNGHSLNMFNKDYIKELDDAYQVVVDVPGIPSENINVQFDNDKLVLTGEVDDEVHGKRKVHKTWRIPTHLVDTENIEASLKNGVLFIKVPKHPKTQPKSIPILET